MEVVHTLLFPVIASMENLYSIGFNISLNDGIAIILMSMFFNFLILPFYYMAELGRYKVQLLQKSMSDEIAAIKKYYKGRERHFYIKSIHSRYGFHQVSVLKASAGTLIQIPFFLAAYYYLDSKETLVGTSFGLISDLSQPDSLLFGAPLLPWCMIITNLLAVYFYPRQKTARDTWQLWFISVVFFVLLYSQASALLLYWTSSNVFSLVKNIIEKTFADFSLVRDGKLWFSRILVLVDFLNKKILRISMVIGSLLIVGILLASYIERNAQVASIALLWSTLLTWSMLGLVLWRMNYGKKAEQPNHLFKAVVQLFVLFIVMLVGIDLVTGLLFVYDNQIASTINLQKNAVFSLLLLNILLITGLITRRIVFFAKSQLSSFIFFTVVCSLSILVFVINPLLFYNSTDDLLINKRFLLVSSFSLVIAISIWSTLIYSAFHPNWKGLSAVVSLAILVIFLTYSFVFTVDYGLMTKFVFAPGAVLPINWLPAMIEIVFVVVIILAIYHIARLKKFIPAIMLGVLVMMGSFIVFNIQNGPEKPTETITSNTMDPVAALENSPMHNFSDDKNILVFILDAFSGSAIEYILNTDPRILANYMGFVWYKNTLSIGRVTLGSMAEVVGGIDYSLESINKSGNLTISQNINDAYNVIPQVFFPFGWQLSYYGMLASNDFNKNVHTTNFDYASYYLQTYQKQLYPKNKLLDEKNILYMTSLFRSTPFVFKAGIYDRGDWMGVLGNDGRLVHVYEKAKSWGLLKALESDMRVDSKKPTIKVLHFLIPHIPNKININGKLHIKSVPYIVEAKAVLLQIGNILQKLKQYGIYDKTKVIVTTDHGYYHPKMKYTDLGTNFDKNFIAKVSADTKGLLHPAVAQALLMVKDFDSTGDIQISNNFMSNGDLLAIMCAVPKNNCDKDLVDPTKNNLDRELTMYFTSGTTQSQYKILDIYKVKNNIFDPANWRKVEKKQ